MTKIKEYLKALGALVTVAVLGVAADVSNAIETELPAVKTAVAALVTAVIVALLRNKPPAA